jgi:hypothetical protein
VDRSAVSARTGHSLSKLNDESVPTRYQMTRICADQWAPTESAVCRPRQTRRNRFAWTRRNWQLRRRSRELSVHQISKDRSLSTDSPLCPEIEGPSGRQRGIQTLESLFRSGRTNFPSNGLLFGLEIFSLFFDGPFRLLFALDRAAGLYLADSRIRRPVIAGAVISPGCNRL